MEKLINRNWMWWYFWRWKY